MVLDRDVPPMKNGPRGLTAWCISRRSFVAEGERGAVRMGVGNFFPRRASKTILSGVVGVVDRVGVVEVVV